MGGKYQLSTLLLLIVATALATDHDSVGRKSPPPEHKEKPALEGMTLLCYQGTVSLGRAKGSIEVEAKCKGVEPREKVLVEVSVARLQGGTGIIKTFRRNPPIVRVAGGRRYGSCFRDQHDPRWKLYCQGEAEGSIVMKGRIWVGEADPCELNVALTSFPKQKRCQGSCALEYVYVVLANGPPRGCD